MPPSAEARLAALLATPWLGPVLAALPGARLVGGCVRDALAGLPAAYIDLATPDPPTLTAERLAAAGLRVLPTGLSHGTLTAISEGRPIEVTTLRRDLSTDGRHAEVAWTTDWRQDAARRDFTLNALSLSPDGVVHDFFGGQADLAAGRLRFVGDPAQRIAEDRLRILRFFRFLARFGSNDPHPATLAAIHAAVPGLAQLSPERVWSELKRLLAGPRAAQMIALMQQTGVLQAVLPGSDPARLARLVELGTPADPVLRLAALSPEDIRPLAARLRLANAERDQVIALRQPLTIGDDGNLNQALADTPAATLSGRAWLKGEPALALRLAAAERPVFPLEGRDALALGLAPGPEIGQALARVRQWWILQTGAGADKAACLDRLRQEIAR